MGSPYAFLQRFVLTEVPDRQSTLRQPWISVTEEDDREIEYLSQWQPRMHHSERTTVVHADTLQHRDDGDHDGAALLRSLSPKTKQQETEMGDFAIFDCQIQRIILSTRNALQDFYSHFLCKGRSYYGGLSISGR